MLKTDGLYSNFWSGMTEDYYYQRTEDYKPILEREKEGCFEVPMVHSCVLIDLRRVHSDLLTYDPDKIPYYDGPIDDIIAFAVSANRSQIPLTLCNDKFYGFMMVPLEKGEGLSHDVAQLTNIKLEVLNNQDPLYVTDLMKQFVPVVPKDKLGFDEIYMINLVRRHERRRRMMHCFDELGLKVNIVDAVDGR